MLNLRLLNIWIYKKKQLAGYLGFSDNFPILIGFDTDLSTVFPLAKSSTLKIEAKKCHFHLFSEDEPFYLYTYSYL